MNQNQFAVGQLPTPSGPPRCPVCGALTPSGESGRPAEWCSLCLAPLRDVPSQPASSESRLSDVGRETNSVGKVESLDEPPAEALDERVVEQMLIELQSSDQDPWLARARHWGSRRRRIVLGAVVALALVLVILVLTTIVGVVVR